MSIFSTSGYAGSVPQLIRAHIGEPIQLRVMGDAGMYPILVVAGTEIIFEPYETRAGNTRAWTSSEFIPKSDDYIFYQEARQTITGIAYSNPQTYEPIESTFPIQTEGISTVPQTKQDNLLPVTKNILALPWDKTAAVIAILAFWFFSE